MNSHVVGGIQANGKAFLGSVDVHGMTIQNNNFYTTGMATYFCPVLLTNAGEPESISESDARKLLEECFRVLSYRDKLCSTKIQIGRVDSTGVHIDEPYEFEGTWDHDRFKSYTNEHSRDIRFWM